jgi:glycosyltransferase involved in cell wall biosynthesis
VRPLDAAARKKERIAMLTRERRSMAALDCAIPDSLHRALDARSRASGESVDHVVRAALADDLLVACVQREVDLPLPAGEPRVPGGGSVARSASRPRAGGALGVEGRGPTPLERCAAAANRVASMSAALRLAILGTRGVPAAYGGFETFAEQLSTRLAARGHDVTVFGREGNVPARLHLARWRGVRVVVLPAPRSKHLETVLHTLRAARVAAREGFDVVFLCNSANFLALPLLRAGGARTALLIDGIESARRKWGLAGRSFYRIAERIGPRLADATIADCDVIRRIYQARGAPRVERIAYGAEPPRATGTAALERIGIRPGGYVLYVSRLEPENNADVVIEAYRRARPARDLVVVGDAPYADAYKARLRDLAAGDPRIHFTGYLFGEGYDELRAHAALYVQATDVGGTHPALLEAMAARLPIVANDIPEHREVLGDAGWYYPRNSAHGLAALLRELLGAAAESPGAGEGERAALRAERARAAQERVRGRYDWDRVTAAYEDLARRLTAT